MSCDQKKLNKLKSLLSHKTSNSINGKSSNVKAMVVKNKRDTNSKLLNNAQSTIISSSNQKKSKTITTTATTPQPNQTNQRKQNQNYSNNNNNEKKIDKKVKEKVGYIDKAKEKLMEGKFRFINELLYTTSSDHALKTFQNEPHLFEDYHAGYRLQVSKWPQNPLDVIHDKIKVRYSQLIAGNSKKGNKGVRKLVVADMGCGEAELARKLMMTTDGTGLCVHSFDLVKNNERITVANIKNVPLPSNSIDIVVFCLSLMGTDYTDFFKEAHRLLRDGGMLLIAEVKSRIEDTRSFGDVLKRQGFRVKGFNGSNKMFVLFDCVKCPRKESGDDVNHSGELAGNGNNDNVQLKACKYKRR